MDPVLDDDKDQTAIDHAAESAAFDASFEGSTVAPAGEAAKTVDTPAPAKAEDAKEKQEPQVAATAAEPTVEAAPTAPSPKAVEPDVQLEIRKLNGRIGALNDQLQQALKAKETEGKPAVLSPVALTRLKAEYPEMADVLEGDIAEVIKSLAQKAPDPQEIQKLVSQGVAAEIDALKREAIDERHENWRTDLWVGEIGKQATPEYAAWLKTLPEAEVHAIENSQSPAFINRKLDQFYDWKNKAAKAATEKQDRLKAAVTPQGTARAGPQTLSDEEAERRAFEDAYNK